MMEKIKSKAGREILVTKASGHQELFLEDKLRGSLERAGAKPAVVDEIIRDIINWADDNISTKEIYNRAFMLLRRKRAGRALRYKLKQALMELGPTGYPFEHFTGMLFKKMGYSIEVGKVIEGHCVTHEMDVIATRDHVQVLVECKYGLDQGKHVSVQVPLYVRARVDDIIRKRMSLPEYHGFSFEGWVVTNTRFTTESLQYGKCSGLHLLGWDYPENKGLKDLLEKEHIYPITLLNDLTKKEKLALLEQDMVTCSVLLQNKDILNQFRFTDKKLKSVIEELEDICD